jgi:hypothetical protein
MVWDNVFPFGCCGHLITETVFSCSTIKDYLFFKVIPVLARQAMSPDLSELKSKYIFCLTKAETQQ